MRIDFDTASLTETEARGLVALLGVLHPLQLPNVTIAASHIDYSPVEASVLSTFGAPDGYPFGRTERTAEGRETTELPTIAIAPDGAKGVGDRDADGILWDERIHTSNKSTKQDGTWKRKPGLEDAYFAQVMAELKAANTARTLEAAAHMVAQPVVPTPPDQPIATPAPTAAEAFTPPASVTIPAHVPAPPAPAVPTPPPVPTGEAPTFPQLIQRITPLQATGKIDAAKLAELLGGVGLKSIAELVSASADARTNLAALLDTVQ